MVAPPRVDEPTDRASATSRVAFVSLASESHRSGAEGAEDERGEAAPWYIANCVTPPLGAERRFAWRRTRYARRQRSSALLIGSAREDAGLSPVAAEPTTSADPEWVRPLRPARCRWRVGAAVTVHHDEERGAHWSGVERCASIWACPVCSAVIRAERAEEIQQAARVWGEEREGSFAFVTLTMRHGIRDPLKTTLNAALEGWRRVIRGAPWKRKIKQLGIAGVIRSVEVTWGADNGWHPHIHALFFLDQTWTKQQADDFEGWLYERWADFVVKLGGQLPTRLRGVDVRLAGRDGTVVAQYLSKVQEKDEPANIETLGAELARFDFKQGRAGNLMPFELLDMPPESGAGRLWVEYVKTTQGRRAITWSKNLRELLALDEERTDEEIIEDTEAAPVVLLMHGPVYDRIKNDPATLASVLEVVELGQRLELVDPDTGELLETFAVDPPD